MMRKLIVLLALTALAGLVCCGAAQAFAEDTGLRFVPMDDE